MAKPAQGAQGIGGVFSKRRLTADQFRSVARMRLADASKLLAAKDRKHANGAVYMAGFAIECLLKALLLDRHPNLASPVDTASLSATDKRVHELLYRLHELDEMLDLMPEIEKKLRAAEGHVRKSPKWFDFKTLCEQWAVYVRYSPLSLDPTDAKKFVDLVKAVRPTLESL